MATVQEIVKGLSEDVQVAAINLEQVKKILQNTVELLALSIKKRFGELPDKTTFLMAIASYLNTKIPTNSISSKVKISNTIVSIFQNFFIEALKLPLVYATILIIDDQTLSKWIGVDWYDQLKAKIANM